MRLGPGSDDDFIDLPGQSGGRPMLGGGGLGLLLPLIASRFGIVGILILLLGYCALSSLGGGGSILGGGGSSTQQGEAFGTHARRGVIQVAGLVAPQHAQGHQVSEAVQFLQRTNRPTNQT